MDNDSKFVVSNDTITSYPDVNSDRGRAEVLISRGLVAGIEVRLPNFICGMSPRKLSLQPRALAEYCISLNSYPNELEDLALRIFNEEDISVRRKLIVTNFFKQFSRPVVYFSDDDEFRQSKLDSNFSITGLYNSFVVKTPVNIRDHMFSVIDVLGEKVFFLEFLLFAPLVAHGLSSQSVKVAVLSFSGLYKYFAQWGNHLCSMAPRPLDAPSAPALHHSVNCSIEYSYSEGSTLFNYQRTGLKSYVGDYEFKMGDVMYNFYNVPVIHCRHDIPPAVIDYFRALHFARNVRPVNPLDLKLYSATPDLYDLCRKEAHIAVLDEVLGLVPADHLVVAPADGGMVQSLRPDSITGDLHPREGTPETIEATVSRGLSAPRKKKVFVYSFCTVFIVDKPLFNEVRMKYPVFRIDYHPMEGFYNITDLVSVNDLVYSALPLPPVFAKDASDFFRPRLPLKWRPSDVNLSHSVLYTENLLNLRGIVRFQCFDATASYLCSMRPGQEVSCGDDLRWRFRMTGAKIFPDGQGTLVLSDLTAASQANFPFYFSLIGRMVESIPLVDFNVDRLHVRTIYCSDRLPPFPTMVAQFAGKFYFCSVSARSITYSVTQHTPFTTLVRDYKFHQDDGGQW